MGKVTVTALGGVDQSEGLTAGAQDILQSKTALVNGTVLEGTIQSRAAQAIRPGASGLVIPAGVYLSGAQTILGDAALAPGNIKAGATIFGVGGIFSGNVPVKTIGYARPYTYQEVSADTTFKASNVLAFSKPFENGASLYGIIAFYLSGVGYGYFWPSGGSYVLSQRMDVSFSASGLSVTVADQGASFGDQGAVVYYW